MPKKNSSPTTDVPSVAVVGAGYWGKNLVRNFHQLGVLKTVCDGAQSVRKQMGDPITGVGTRRH